MKSLQQLQEKMQAYVLEENTTVKNSIVKTDEMTTENRLNVYRNAYYLRLVEVLRGDYEILYKLLGDDAFSGMARKYLEAYPSHHFSVRTVGRSLAKFLRETEKSNLIYSELAEFEWSLIEVMFARDVDVLTMDILAKIPLDNWPAMQLHIQPAVNLIRTCYNTLEYWQSIDKNSHDVKPEKLDEPIFNLVWRSDLEIHYCSITIRQHHLFTAIGSGKNFAELCELMLEHFENEEEAVQWVATTLQTWVNEGIFKR